MEESLAWRTRIYPRKATEWTPPGISFGAAKPSIFVIEEAGGFPFLRESERPTVVEGAKSGWNTHGLLRFEEQPPLIEEMTDAPQFGVKVISDRAGLRLTRPSFTPDFSVLENPLVVRPAWMPDSVEFRVERGSGDSAVFSMHNADSRHVVTFHNVRYAVESAEIELSARILLDQTIPLAYAFTDLRQVETPPVIMPKPTFATFQSRFPQVPLPLILVPGADSREFVLGELTLGRWIYVEGFATRTDRDGRPILDDRGLPEVPSEFRYGFRLNRRSWPKIDLTRYQKWSDDDLIAGGIAGRRGLFSEQTPLPGTASGFGFRFGGLGSGGSGVGGGGFGGGGLNSGGSGENVGAVDPGSGSHVQTGQGGTIPPVTGGGAPAYVVNSTPFHPDAPASPTVSKPPDIPPLPLSAVPEPATWIGACLGALGLIAGLLRRNARR